jgi:CHAT domain-containing protein/tetratricopeptide (TPR) repeat protein
MKNYKYFILFSIVLLLFDIQSQVVSTFENDTALFFQIYKSDKSGVKSIENGKALIKTFTDRYGKNAKETGVAYFCSGLSYKKAKQIDTAIIQFKKAYEIHYNKYFSDFYNAERQLSICYFDRGEWQPSLEMQEESIDYIKQHVLKNSDTLRVTFNSLGIVYSKLGNYSKSDEFYNLALQIVEGKKDSLRMSTLFNNMALNKARSGHFEKCDDYFDLSEQIIRNRLNNFSDSARLINVYNSKGYVYSLVKKYNEARSAFIKCYEFYEIPKAKKNYHHQYIENSASFAIVLIQLGEYLFAEKIVKNAIESCSGNSDFAWHDLSQLYLNLALLKNYLDAPYSEIKNYLDSASNVIEQHIAPSDPIRAELLLDKAQILLDHGKFKEVKFLLDSVKIIQNKAYGKESIFSISRLILESNYQRKDGHLEEAITLLEEARNIALKKIGNECLEYGEILYFLGQIHTEMGEYKKAEEELEEAQKIIFKLVGQEHFLNADILNAFGILNYRLGELKQASFFIHESLNLRKKIFGVQHKDYSSSLNNIGVLFSDFKQYDSTLFYYFKAFNILKVNHLNDVNTSNTISNIGLTYLKLRNFDSAYYFLNQAYEIRLANLENPNHPKIISSETNLALYYDSIKSFKKADSLYRQALRKTNNVYGDKNINYINQLTWHTLFLRRWSRKEEAYSMIVDLFNKKRELVNSNFNWLSDQKKEEYWKKLGDFFDQIYLFASEDGKEYPHLIKLAYDCALFQKGKLLESTVDKDDTYYNVVDLHNELNDTRKLLYKLESEGSNDAKKIKQLEKYADSLDQVLTKSWPQYRITKSNLSIDFRDVEGQLKNGSSAIEFIQFKNSSNQIQYAALILNKEDSIPILVNLCLEEDISNIAIQQSLDVLFDKIWSPLQEHLSSINKIYVSPVGYLHNIPFKALIVSSEMSESLAKNKSNRGVIASKSSSKEFKSASYLMDFYEIHELTSTRMLSMGLMKKEKEHVSPTLAIVGGVDYDFFPSVSSNLKPKVKKSTQNKRSSSISGKLPYLPGTKTELDSVVLKTKGHWSIFSFQGTDAKEEIISLFENEHAKGILHIATHGYAFTSGKISDTARIDKNSYKYNYRFHPNPMVRSGLILAGGNWAWMGSDTLRKLGAEEDGILTALEVSRLNLRKTKLVVLSACETGLGKIEGSEGTFGLKRGFKLAGVEQMIVSLWSVPDKETMELMTLFYTDLTKTLNPVISFSNAQKEMRNKYPTDPEKWAGFVLVR